MRSQEFPNTLGVSLLLLLLGSPYFARQRLPQACGAQVASTLERGKLSSLLRHPNLGSSSPRTSPAGPRGRDSRFIAPAMPERRQGHAPSPSRPPPFISLASPPLQPLESCPPPVDHDPPRPQLRATPHPVAPSRLRLPQALPRQGPAPCFRPSAGPGEHALHYHWS
ncbi:keratinocyte proline-rich protein-like [Pan paniscus]|uniref:keratinocyte proline-rich protein-like n=1 Tax=Pan paniscus TaxID=9597 RepID=UPI003004F26B